MVPIASYYGDFVQVAMAAISTILMLVSMNAYRRRAEGRYLLLMLAFVFLCITSVSTAFLELFTNVGPTTIQLVELYLNPSLELLTAVSFLVALLWSSRAKKRVALAFLVTAIAIGMMAASALYVSVGSDNGTIKAPLPAGCVKPPGGFLVIASSLGYNDSMAHGAPVKSWPVLDVANGTNVNITVCNTYSDVVGFQVAHYLDEKVETIQPGRVINVSFVADQTGTFLIYCSVFNPIHIYLQGGELKVL